jgi:hypothetical protein
MVPVESKEQSRILGLHDGACDGPQPTAVAPSTAEEQCFQTSSPVDVERIPLSTCPDGEDTEPAEELTPSLALSAVQLVPVGSLLASDSPRLAGVNDEHVHALTDAESALPAIIVRRSTMRVIDGMHRLRAAMLRGEREIAVRFFDGTEKDAFVFAVVENTRHGLPLSATDRMVAAERILRSHPQWSDRAVSVVAGISAKSVRALRLRGPEQEAHVDARVGRDGRVRPLDCAAGRLRASQLISGNPGFSLREIAKQAGVSPSTARDVRDRLHRGDDPVPSGQQRRQLLRRTAGEDRTAMLAKLMNDPSLRLTESGRHLLRLLTTHAIYGHRREQLVRSVPPHATSIVSELARECARAWTNIADELDCGLAACN